jgi:hypothetical protein
MRIFALSTLHIITICFLLGSFVSESLAQKSSKRYQMGSEMMNCIQSGDNKNVCKKRERAAMYWFKLNNCRSNDKISEKKCLGIVRKLSADEKAQMGMYFMRNCGKAGETKIECAKKVKAYLKSFNDEKVIVKYQALAGEKTWNANTNPHPVCSHAHPGTMMDNHIGYGKVYNSLKNRYCNKYQRQEFADQLEIKQRAGTLKVATTEDLWNWCSSDAWCKSNQMRVLE